MDQRDRVPGRGWFGTGTRDRPLESPASTDKCWRNSASSSTASLTRGIIQRNDYPKRPQNSLVVTLKQEDNHRQRLDLQSLVKLTSDEIEPSEIIRCLNNDLATELEINHRNPEYLELVLVAMGGFCRKNGPSQFTQEFATIVSILAHQKVFAQIITIYMNIPSSRAQNLPTKEERLKRLTSAIYHLATDILTIMPAFGCNWLGQNFFTDILFMKSMPSIKCLDVADAFDVLEDGVLLLQTVWNEHVLSENKKDLPRTRVQEAPELVFELEDPPDNFRTLNIMISPEDVSLDVVPFLRPNIVKVIYPDVETYLDIHFRLLREDFFQPLRLGLLAYKNRTDWKSSRGSDNVRFYQPVRIVEYEMENDAYVIQFSTTNLRKIAWEKSKRFLHGSLLCLSTDNFSSFLIFTVVNRDIDLLYNGQIKVKFEGGILPVEARKQTFVMAESMIFFESYRSILTVLQRTSPDNFPMEDYILGRNSTPERPHYLSKEIMPITYDLSCVRTALNDVKLGEAFDARWRRRVDGDRNPRPVFGELRRKDDVKDALREVYILDPNDRPDANALGLDSSQAAALFAALSQQISVIQGPPGTGKTFLGLRIVQTLLKNSHFWNEEKTAPILVICYTNHALDQFLEGILKFTQRVVRIGGQSKCEALKSYSLIEWKRNRPGRHGHDIQLKRNEIQEDLNQLNWLRKCIHEDLLAMNSNSLIHEDSLLDMKIIPTAMQCKIRVLLKPLKRQHPKTWTALGFWLQIYQNEAMEETLRTFKREGLKTKRQTTKHPQVTGEIKVKDESPDEPEWDKEHVDEIEASRKVDEEEEYYLMTNLKSPKKDQVVKPLNNNPSVKFAYKSREIEDELARMRKALETVEGEDEEWFKGKIEELEVRLALVHQLLKVVPQVDQKQLKNWYERDLLEIPLPDRWMMYNSWKSRALAIQGKRASSIEKKYVKKAEELKDVRSLESADVCEKADVVGLTTTGAAKQRVLLNHIKPKIVIVEEAAEVLEAHVVCALSSSCEQLILIGDHKQLRPSVTVHELAKKFFLDVSLFERLVKNGMEPVVLEVQHRMRPEVARLIVPAIYPRLENHKSVLEYPNIRGMDSNVFFLTHTQHEVGDYEGKSHLNPYEADISLALARHLIMQGYAPEEITILTTYSGQRLHFWKIRQDYSAVQSVRISVVDDFQGEENDIIILSLVRSNCNDYAAIV